MTQSKNMDLYVDVDGVFLGRDEDGRSVLIPDIEKVLRYAKSNFSCFWLTTHGRHSVQDVFRYLKPYAADVDLSLFMHIQSATWKNLKTEAIDFSKPFIWIDDRPLQAELRVLKNRNCLKNWLHVDTYRNILDLTVEKIEVKRKELLGQKKFNLKNTKKKF